MKRIVNLFLTVCLSFSMFSGCFKIEGEEKTATNFEVVKSMDLSYADQFSVDYYKDGYKMISLADGSKFLVVPENMEKPEGLSEDVVPLYQPIDNIYLVATSAMSLFNAMDQLGAIKLSGTKADGWYTENAVEAMNNGEILYAGKYSEPDYEMILENKCDLAIESSMIYHAPEVQEKLESLGIPVFVDQSSREKHPLGRTEWIKLYGALLNQEEVADKLFAEQASYLDKVSSKEKTGKTVAFFNFNSSGMVVARKTGDYISTMLELAGAEYIFDNLGSDENNLPTEKLEMETFFATAKDADYMIYNGTLGGEIKTLEEFLALHDLLKECKAVKNGNVWCTNKSMYQETMDIGKMIENFNKIFTSDDPSLTKLDYLYKLQ